MSPGSRRKRRLRQHNHRDQLKNLLKKMKETDVELNDTQHNEMQQISNIIQSDHQPDLEEALVEASGNDANKKKHLSKIWGLVVTDRQLFADDQKRNVTGYRGN